MNGKNVKRVKGNGSLASRVIALIETARQRVATVANVAQVYTNYEIGRQIVEEEQGGKRRADYGKQKTLWGQALRNPCKIGLLRGLSPQGRCEARQSA